MSLVCYPAQWPAGGGSDATSAECHRPPAGRFAWGGFLRLWPRPAVCGRFRQSRKGQRRRRSGRVISCEMISSRDGSPGGGSIHWTVLGSTGGWQLPQTTTPQTDRHHLNRWHQPHGPSSRRPGAGCWGSRGRPVPGLSGRDRGGGSKSDSSFIGPSLRFSPAGPLANLEQEELGRPLFEAFTPA